MNKKPVSLKILIEPMYKVFYIEHILSFMGLLLEVTFDDGSTDFISDPELEYPDVKYPGVYKAVAYYDKTNYPDVNCDFKFRVISDDFGYQD